MSDISINDVVVVLIGVNAGRKGVATNVYGYLGFQSKKRQAVTVNFVDGTTSWYHIDEVARITS